VISKSAILRGGRFLFWASTVSQSPVVLSGVLKGTESKHLRLSLAHQPLRRHNSLRAEEVGAAVIQDVLAFSGGKQFDDLTLIVARRDG